MKENRFYATVRIIVKGLLCVLFPFKVSGAENIPKDGAVILCGNHVSMLDPLFLAAASKRYIRFISKKELFEKKLLGSVFRRLGMFPVDRGESDIAAMRTCLSILKENGVLGIYPQGHRYPADDNRDLKSGTALMAIRSRIPLIPVHVSGPVRIFRKTTVRIGKPIDISDITRPDSTALQTVNKRLIEGIWAKED